ncbi:MAG TPA: PD-(D/E)XK nuclease family protein [Thermodesulfovibrionales bacterium]|nr:PD-(D/E)XK nuclease family protein [Thermodesulfovibrionales bacterium]
MNIFQVLSQGKSRLHEPSMSAMLGYLLDSNKDHGLGDAFVRVFLKKLNADLFKNVLSLDFINSQVSLEEPYQLNNGSRNYIDIQVSLIDRSRKEESHRIIIENKIKVGAANPKQLLEYYNAVLQDDSEIENLVMLFLTPESGATALKTEYENLKKLPKRHYKEWLFWDSSEKGGVLSLIRDVLNMEAQGEINPINEYMRHTLKAFVRHSSAVVQPKGVKTMRTGEDIGEIIDEATIKLKDGTSY